MARRNCCRSIIKFICSAILGCIMFVLVPLFLLLLTPLYLIRWIISKLGPCIDPKLSKILHTRGATLSVDSIYEGIPLNNIFVAGIVDGIVSLDVFRENAARVMLSKNPDGSLCNQEGQQYIVSWMGYHFWKWDEDFKIENHVRYYDGIYADRIAKEGVTEELQPLLGAEFIRTPFTPKRSPWEAYLAHNVIVKDGDPVNKPKSLLVLRIHHSLADGFAVLKVITVDLMVAQYERAQAAYFQKTLWEKMYGLVFYLFKAPFEGAFQFIESVDFNEWHIAENRLARDHHVALTPRIPLDIIKDLKNQHNTSFTCILLAAFAGGIRKFMIEHQYKVPRSIHCLTPLPMPGHPSKLRNHLTLCIITLPLDVDNPLERIEEVAAELERQRTSSVPLSMFISGPIFGALPASVIKATYKNYATTAVLTSMPGPDRVIDFLGCPLDDVVFGGGLLRGNCGVGLSSLSYNGAIRIGTGVDTNILSNRSDVEEIVQNIQDELTVLKNLDV
ncbi:unnamed protein product [Allacma fusca]|uniref:O-acyltransferase WSD1 C-terminal domain-containing protein n=1 Tax=Allacma fusca TaxID=39272 RepID=A0A8J2PRY8_9HEXA|nr:unnamed protein product [Allacma fusca]